MAVGDIYKVTIVFTNSNTGENVTTGYHVKQIDVGTPSMTQIGDEVKDWWNTAFTSGVAMKSLYGAAIALDHIELRRVVPSSVTVESYTTGLPIAGTDAGNSGDPKTAILLSLRTDSIGRRYRGRMFLPPFSELDLTGATIIDTATTLAVATQFARLADAHMGNITNNAEIGIYSAVGGFITPMTVVKVDQNVRSQRRRQVNNTAYQTAAV